MNKHQKVILSQEGMRRTLRYFGDRGFAIVPLTQPPLPLCKLPKYLKDIILDLPDDRPNLQDIQRIKYTQKIFKAMNIGYIKHDSYFRNSRYQPLSYNSAYFIPVPPDRKIIDMIAGYLNQPYFYGDGRQTFMWEQEKTCAPHRKTAEFEIFYNDKEEYGLSEIKKGEKGQKYCDSSGKFYKFSKAKAMWFPEKSVTEGSIIVSVAYRSRGKYGCPLALIEVDADWVKAAKEGFDYDYWFVV